MSFLKPLLKIFDKRCLVFTNTITGTVFFASADVIEQQLLQKKVLKKEGDHDLKRTVAMTGIGTYFGIAGHFWYRFLDTRFPAKSRLSVPKKLLAEMAIGPPFAATTFFMVGHLEAKPWRESWDGLRNNALYLCIADWLFYVPLQALNFHFLAPKFRFLFVATISLVYDIFLSHVLHRS